MATDSSLPAPETPLDRVTPAVLLPVRRRWVRLLWMAAGALSLLLGVLGIFLPLLPTTPFVLLAAACFSRGSERCDRWLLAHPRFGPMVRDWRACRAVPLRAKQLATVMMVLGSGLAAWTLPVLPWLPGLCCLGVLLWLWSLPTREKLQRLSLREPAGPDLRGGRSSAGD